MKRLICFVIVSTCVAIFNHRAQAIEGIGNLEEIFPDGGIGEIHGIFPEVSYAVTFNTGGDHYSVDSVVLEHFGFDPDPKPNLEVLVYRQPESPPITDIILVGQLSQPTLDPAPTQWPGETMFVRYTPMAPITLEPNTIYWIVARLAPNAPEEVALMFVNWTRAHTGFCDWDYWFFNWFGFVEDGVQRWIPDSEALKFKVEVTPASNTLPHCNQPPDISGAHASVTNLWPPNHAMVPIKIEGISDPDGDELVVTVTAIMQDEPVSGLDDPSPDGAGLFTDTAVVRAERAPTGNGRVYTISYAVTDLHVRVDGTVKVRVPHDNAKGLGAIDDGELYDSTIP